MTSAAPRRCRRVIPLPYGADEPTLYASCLLAPRHQGPCVPTPHAMRLLYQDRAGPPYGLDDLPRPHRWWRSFDDTARHLPDHPAFARIFVNNLELGHRVAYLIAVDAAREPMKDQ